MQYKDLMTKNADELRGLAADSRKQLAHLNRQIAVQGVKNVREIRVLRKDIARIETRLTALSQQSTT